MRAAEGAIPPESRLTAAPSRPRRIAFLAAAIWLLTVAMAVALLWVGLFTDFGEQSSAINGATPTFDDIATRAYYIHLEAGGDPFENWIRAERELVAA